MSVCCPHAVSAGKFFSRFARFYRWRFNKMGFEPPQKALIQGLTTLGFQDATLLEIGCGVGHLHQTLLERGAKSAIGIDLAASMLREAKIWAEQRGLKEKTRYLEGDFINLAPELSKADITLLDKVVCCYPDAKLLVGSSMAKTKHLYALVYPRNRWYTRLAVGFAAVMMRLFRSNFRPYVHDPIQIEAWIAEYGFKKQFAAQGLIWLTQIYQSSSRAVV